MSAFSYHQIPSVLLDSLLLQHSTAMEAKNMVGAFWDEELPTINGFSHVHPPHNGLFPAAKLCTDAQVDYHSSKSAAGSENRDLSVVKKQSATDQSSTVVDKHENALKSPAAKRRRSAGGSSLCSAASKQGTRERKSKKQKKPLEEVEEESKPTPVKKTQKKPPEESPTGYIHVRARRGQATDSHSLAERVRREKISERMKILQRLVPGCEKVSGKALVLDEIINYVQSLQNQVEFLSMKLSAVNPLFYEYGVDLEDFLVRPECLSNMDSSMTPVDQRFPPIQPLVYADATTASATATATAMETSNSCTLMESSSLTLLQGQRPIDLTQVAASLVCDSDRQRQKFLNPVWFDNNFEFFPLK